MKKIIYGLVSFLPVLAFAQTAPTPQLGFLKTNVVTPISNAISALIPVIFGLAIVYFFWGLIQYIRSAGDPAAAAKGKSIMIYGVIAIFVMASIYGLIAWLQGATGVSNTNTITPPSVSGLGQ